jgi:DNA-binding response OmpR family regulator
MKLLLAEDQPQLAKPVRVMLEKSGFSVEVASDGAQALDMLRNGEYDGVLLDIMMPKMDGWEILSILRSEGNQVPVMLLTARDTLDDKVRGLEGGADDYLTKPFEMRELVARVRALTRTRATETSNTMLMGDVMLRRSSQEILSEYGSFRLNPKEYRMAEMLAHSNGRPVSVGRLAEKMWPHGDVDDIDSAVSLYVSYLGNKMKALHSAKRIIHVGDGYAIAEGDSDDRSGNVAIGESSWTGK